MRTYWVYMLHCADNTYYVGVTNDIERRYNEHVRGRNADAYTHERRPVQLVYSTTFSYILDAIAWEKQIKRWGRAKKEALIRGDFEKLPKLAECQNKTHSKYFKGPLLDYARSDNRG